MATPVTTCGRLTRSRAKTLQCAPATQPATTIRKTSARPPKPMPTAASQSPRACLRDVTNTAGLEDSPIAGVVPEPKRCNFPSKDAPSSPVQGQDRVEGSSNDDSSVDSPPQSGEEILRAHAMALLESEPLVAEPVMFCPSPCGSPNPAGPTPNNTPAFGAGCMPPELDTAAVSEALALVQQDSGRRAPSLTVEQGSTQQSCEDIHNALCGVVLQHLEPAARTLDFDFGSPDSDRGTGNGSPVPKSRLTSVIVGPMKNLDGPAVAESGQEECQHGESGEDDWEERDGIADSVQEITDQFDRWLMEEDEGEHKQQETTIDENVPKGSLEQASEEQAKAEQDAKESTETSSTFPELVGGSEGCNVTEKDDAFNQNAGSEDGDSPSRWSVYTNASLEGREMKANLTHSWSLEVNFGSPERVLELGEGNGSDGHLMEVQDKGERYVEVPPVFADPDPVIPTGKAGLAIPAAASPVSPAVLPFSPELDFVPCSDNMVSMLPCASCTPSSLSPGLSDSPVTMMQGTSLFSTPDNTVGTKLLAADSSRTLTGSLLLPTPTATTFVPSQTGVPSHTSIVGSFTKSFTGPTVQCSSLGRASPPAECGSWNGPRARSDRGALHQKSLRFLKKALKTAAAHKQAERERDHLQAQNTSEFAAPKSTTAGRSSVGTVGKTTHHGSVVNDSAAGPGGRGVDEYDALCDQIQALEVVDPNLPVLHGLPVPTGRHIRFAEAGHPPKLRGVPTPRGNHTMFADEEASP